jgi:hypothetical protein
MDGTCRCYRFGMALRRTPAPWAMLATVGLLTLLAVPPN